MKHLKTFERFTSNYTYECSGPPQPTFLENPSIFITHIFETYLEDMYGFYDYELRRNKTNDDYTLKVIFVDFDDSSANELNKLSEYLSYKWNLDMRRMRLKEDEIERFYMVAQFEIDIDDFVEDIKLNNTTDKYNL